MREVTVPVDLVSEMKNIMGRVSTRQLVYLIIGGIFSYQIIFYLPSPLIGIYRYIFNTVIAFPVISLTLGLSFVYFHAYDMFLDKYLWYWWKSRKQIKIWYYHHLVYGCQSDNGKGGRVMG